jgi:non-lysosomal glucosylceramidase
MERRDVLKILSATPFLGLSGGKGARAAQGASSSSSATAPWRVFEEPFLSEIAFPLGGIGTGTVSLGGRGELRDWEIANKPDKGRTLTDTFFALWFREEGSEPRTMILESELKPPYRGAFGIPREGLPGMPRFRKARFLGSYPFARLELEDARVPWP